MPTLTDWHNIFIFKSHSTSNYICAMPVYELTKELVFPPVSFSREDGLLAIGGDVTAQRLFVAYKSGIFPWYNPSQPILWWSPNPRFVLYPHQIKVSKSLKQAIKNKGFKVTYNTQFEQVISNCQQLERKGQDGTWITKPLKQGLIDFHHQGWAHSVEVWQNNQLVGGLYGIAMGKCFFGESMFTKVSDASKVGFVTLVKKLAQLDFHIIDCQVYTNHLETLGAVNIPRKNFIDILKQYVGKTPEKLVLNE